MKAATIIYSQLSYEGINIKKMFGIDILELRLVLKSEKLKFGFWANWQIKIESDVVFV